MSNGYPISALCGQSRIMSEIVRLGITLTYFRSPVSMAASISTIQQMIEIEGPTKLLRSGERLQRNVQQLSGNFQERFELIGHPSMPDPMFKGVPEYQQQKCRELLCFAMLRKGILTPATHHWFLSVSMSEDDIDFLSETTVEVAREVLDKIAQ